MRPASKSKSRARSHTAEQGLLSGRVRPRTPAGRDADPKEGEQRKRAKASSGSVLSAIWDAFQGSTARALEAACAS